MDFLADLAARRDCHDHNLLVLTGDYLASEGIVCLGCLDDVHAAGLLGLHRLLPASFRPLSRTRI
jgi:hypothetical protein